MSIPSETDLRAEIDTLKAELAALRRLLGVSATGTFAEETSLRPRFANLEIGPPGGRPLILLGEGKGAGELNLWNEKDQQIVRLGAFKSCPMLTMFAPASGKPVVNLGYTPDEGETDDLLIGGHLTLREPNGQSSIDLTAYNQGGSIAVDDSDGNPAIQLSSHPFGPSITFRTPTGDDMMSLITGSEGAAIRLFDSAGKSRILLTTENDDASLYFCTAKGTPSITITARDPANPAIHIFTPGQLHGVSLITTSAGGQMAIFNADASHFISLSHDSSIGARLSFIDTQANQSCLTLCVGNDTYLGGLYFVSPDYTPLVSILADPAGGQIHLFNELGIKRIAIDITGDQSDIILYTAGNGSIGLAANETSTGLITTDADADITNHWPGDDDEE